MIWMMLLRLIASSQNHTPVTKSLGLFYILYLLCRVHSPIFYFYTYSFTLLYLCVYLT